MARMGVIVAVVLAACLSACQKTPPPRLDVAPPPQVEAPPAAPISLDQGWTDAETEAWNTTSQGSRLLPIAWAKALEAADSEAIFFTSAHMARFQYLPPETGDASAWPVGFVADDTVDTRLTRTKLRWYAGQGAEEPWLGMTCAACHTGEVAYKGTRLRVQGGPTLADYQGFIEGFVAALRATRTDAAKWDRFAARVLAEDTPANRKLLQAAFDRLLAFEDRSLAMNATDLRYGYGRLDAVGHILNRVSQLAGPAAPGSPADAPVSYPFIWNTSQSDVVQWNGIAQNKRIGPVDLGALGRNIGEVTGVFADIAYTKSALPTAYASSVQAGNLIELEEILARLKPPAWPSALLGTPDPARVAAGRALFGERCASCHTHLDRNDLKTPFKAKMALFNSAEPPGTDIWMACNAFINRAPTGVLAGALRSGETVTAPRTPLAREDFTRNMLKVSVERTMLGKADQIVEAVFESWRGVDAADVATIASAQSEREERRRFCETTRETGPRPTLGYKARPLTGIWATAPYLHNGSAPTLYDVLLPEAMRPRSFAVGGREFDPVKVGFVQDGADGRFRFETHKDGAPIDGNSNAGHDYGAASLSEEDRWSLVEYMKTL